MSLESFLREMTEAGQQATGGGSGIVGKVLVEFGVHRYATGHDFWEFWQVTRNKAEITPKTKELMAKLQAIGVQDKPNFGVKITIFKDVLTSDEPYKRDLMEFVPVWQKGAYDMMLQALTESGITPGQEVWAKVEYKANPFSVAKGEAGKTDKDQDGNPRFPTIRVPVRKFSSKEEAQAFVSENGALVELPPFSDKAKEAYGGDLTQLQNLAAEISKWLGQAQQGTAFNNDPENFPLPTPPTKPNLEKYISDIYSIEPADLKLLVVESPF